MTELIHDEQRCADAAHTSTPYQVGDHWWRTEDDIWAMTEEGMLILQEPGCPSETPIYDALKREQNARRAEASKAAIDGLKVTMQNVGEAFKGTIQSIGEAFTAVAPKPNTSFDYSSMSKQELFIACQAFDLLRADVKITSYTRAKLIAILEKGR